VVLCLNKLDLTKRCIEHIRKSTVPCEIVLVDNGSTDGTQDWAREQQDIAYVRNRVNLGCAVGRTQGAEWATGDYFFFIDNDQFIPPELIARMLAVRKDMVGVEHWEITPSGITKPATGPVKRVDYVGSGGMIVKREVFRKVGGYDFRYAPCWYEDVDFCMRVKAAGYRVGHIENSGVEHLRGSTSNSSDVGYCPKNEKGPSRSLFTSTWHRYLFGNKSTPAGAIPNRNANPHGKPRIFMLCDVRGWAWDYKTQQIVKWLSDDFDFTVGYGSLNGDRSGYDAYFSYEPPYMARLREGGVPPNRIITGVTAHTYVNFRNFRQDLSIARAIHANSKLLLDEISAFNPSCYYVPNGVDEELFVFKERDLSKPFTVGFVGKPNPRKGYTKYIAEACRRADVELRAQVCKFDGANVIQRANMPEFYHDVDCILVASDMDGTPNMLLEAAAIGRPCVGNAIGNIPEFIEDGVNGFIVERQVNAYVEKLFWLKTHREECIEMGRAARKTVEAGWTWKIQTENYKKMFEECLS